MNDAIRDWYQDVSAAFLEQVGGLLEGIASW